MRWALRDLFRHPVRTALSVVGVAIASALLLDMMLLSGGLERSFERLLLSRGFQIRVTPKGTLPFDTEATMSDSDRLVAVIRRDPDVVVAGAMLATSVYARLGTGVTPLVGYGVDPEAQGFYTVESGSDLAPTDSTGLLLGQPAARLLGATIGDTVLLFGNMQQQMATMTGDHQVVVRGIVRFLYDSRNQPSIALALPIARRIAGPGAAGRASVIMVRAREDATLADVRDRIQVAVPTVSVNSTEQMVAQFRTRLSYFRQLSFVLGTIALIVTVMLIGTLLAVTVNERFGDIATMRAIGVSRDSILGGVLVQGMALTVAGGALGMLLGLLSARWLDAILTSFPGLPSSISFFVVDARPLAGAASVLLITGLMAGLLPAWQAASAPIAMTLRNDAP